MSVDSHLMEFIPIIQKCFFLVSFDANSQDVNADKKHKIKPALFRKLHRTLLKANLVKICNSFRFMLK